MEYKNISLPFWLNAGNLKKYASFLNAWYLYAKSILDFTLDQFDIDLAHITIVNLVAWERDIDRFNSEPEWLYRNRVKHAYQNARDAGSVAGFKRIWERMELGYLEVEERLPLTDWDIVHLVITENTIATQPELLDIIIEKYGRTCRRYQWTTIANLKINLRGACFDNSSDFITARL